MLDYGMAYCVNVEIRAAKASDLLRQWRFYCILKQSFTGNLYQLWLLNCQALYGVMGLNTTSSFDYLNIKDGVGS